MKRGLSSIQSLRDGMRKLRVAVTPILKEIKERCALHDPDYNEDSHIQLTITIKEARALDQAIKESRHHG